MQPKMNEEDLLALCPYCGWALDEYYEWIDPEAEPILDAEGVEQAPAYFEDEDEVGELGWTQTDMGIVCPECATTLAEDAEEALANHEFHGAVESGTTLIPDEEE